MILPFKSTPRAPSLLSTRSGTPPSFPGFRASPAGIRPRTRRTRRSDEYRTELTRRFTNKNTPRIALASRGPPRASVPRPRGPANASTPLRRRRATPRAFHANVRPNVRTTRLHAHDDDERAREKNNSQPIPTLTALGLTALTKESAACIVHFLGVTSVQSNRGASRAIRGKQKRLGFPNRTTHGGLNIYL